MSDHEREHRPLLEELFGGTRGAEDVKIIELIRTCAECEREVDEVQQLTEALDQIGAAERTDLAAADPIQPVDVDLARRTLTPLIASMPRWARRRWIAVAAAIGLGAIVWWIEDGSHRWDAKEDYLGVDPVGDAAPVGLVEQWGEFHWPGTGVPPGRGEYRLTLRGIRFDREKGEWALTPFELPLRKLTTPRWDPSDMAEIELPDAIEWTVQRFDASGRELRSDSSRRAWLPSGAPRGS